MVSAPPVYRVLARWSELPSPFTHGLVYVCCQGPEGLGPGVQYEQGVTDDTHIKALTHQAGLHQFERARDLQCVLQGGDRDSDCETTLGRDPSPNYPLPPTWLTWIRMKCGAAYAGSQARTCWYSFCPSKVWPGASCTAAMPTFPSHPGKQTCHSQLALQPGPVLRTGWEAGHKPTVS